MTLVERLRERRAAYYGSQHEELRRVLDMAIARIEAADRALKYVAAIASEQDKEGTDA